MLCRLLILFVEFKLRLVATYFDLLRENITSKFQILRSAFEEEAKRIGRPRLLLTAAVAAGEGTIETAYEIGPISK